MKCYERAWQSVKGKMESHSRRASMEISYCRFGVDPKSFPRSTIESSVNLFSVAVSTVHRLKFETKFGSLRNSKLE